MKSKNHKTGISYWIAGVRLYLGIGILLATTEVWWWGNAAYDGGVTVIRIEEAYAWLSLGLLGVALVIGPLCKLVPLLPGKQILLDARRLIGIGAAWFAVLHVVIAYATQFKFSNPLLLPESFKWAFALGALSLIILLAMAFTSFDKAMGRMGVWWFRLHRLIYAAGLLTMTHAFMIGVHATSTLPLLAIGITSVVLVAMHAAVGVLRKPQLLMGKIVSILGAAVLVLAVLGYGYTRHAEDQKDSSSSQQNAGHAHS